MSTTAEVSAMREQARNEKSNVKRDTEAVELIADTLEAIRSELALIREALAQPAP